MSEAWEERYEPSKKHWQTREKKVGDFRLRVQYQGDGLWQLYISHPYTSWSNGGAERAVEHEVLLVSSDAYSSAEAACEAGDAFLAAMLGPALEEPCKAAYARGLGEGRKQVVDEHVKQLRYIANSRRASMEHYSNLANQTKPVDAGLEAEAQRYRIEADEIDHLADMFEKAIKS